MVLMVKENDLFVRYSEMTTTIADDYSLLYYNVFTDIIIWMKREPRKRHNKDRYTVSWSY